MRFERFPLSGEMEWYSLHSDSFDVFVDQLGNQLHVVGYFCLEYAQIRDFGALHWECVSFGSSFLLHAGKYLLKLQHDDKIWLCDARIAQLSIDSNSFLFQLLTSEVVLWCFCELTNSLLDLEYLCHSCQCCLHWFPIKKGTNALMKSMVNCCAECLCHYVIQTAYVSLHHFLFMSHYLTCCTSS